MGGGTTERYEFTWVGKNASRVEANTTTNKTLRPCIEESKDWDNTENLYIEGDNLEVLKLLQNSYFNKVKMIYIDPPYNTGNDFIYVDDFAQNIDEYEEAKGSFDEEGNRLFKNTDTNGRFHSDWCSMIYPRLVLARNLLADDGVIFISIDDNEQANLKKICDEVFGEKNFIAKINWKGRGGRQDSKYFAIVHEYILIFVKNRDSFIAGEKIKKEEVYPFFDKLNNRFYKRQLLRKWGSNSRREDRPNLFYPIKTPNDIEIYPMLNDKEEGCWRWGKSKMNEAIKNNLVEFIEKDKKIIAYEKIYQPQDGNQKTEKYITWIDDIGTGAKELKELFNKIIFDYSKSHELIIKFLNMANLEENDIILDFFSGSATTAHAVMQLNAEDGGKRKFIMVQLPEKTDEKSEAFKAGYENICEIGKERIRRAGKKIKEEAGLNGQDLDIGFRVLKLDSSNMKDIYYSADEYNQGMLENMQSNTKEDRTDLDLLFGCLVDWGLELDKPYTTKVINGHKVHIYNDGDLVACFENDLDMKTIDEIAKLQALRVVFSDNSFIDSATKINVAEHFKMIAPDTDIKVI